METQSIVPPQEKAKASSFLSLEFLRKTDPRSLPDPLTAETLHDAVKRMFPGERALSHAGVGAFLSRSVREKGMREVGSVRSSSNRPVTTYAVVDLGVLKARESAKSTREVPPRDLSALQDELLDAAAALTRWAAGQAHGRTPISEYSDRELADELARRMARS